MVLIFVKFEKSYRWSPSSLTSAIHSHMTCREQKSSSAGMGCTDTSLLQGTDPSSCCTAFARKRNEGQPGSNRVFFHKIDSKGGGWKRDKTNPVESFTNIPTGRKSERAEGCSLYSLIYQGAYLWYALTGEGDTANYIWQQIFKKINATTPEIAEI